MRRELWPKVESVFAQALEHPEAGRQEWIARSCTDPEVRAEVEALLGVYTRAEEFFRSAPGLLTGARLGPYDIVDLIGAGGMGEVYRARDPRIGREVAIKVLPPSLAADIDRVRRFTLEVHAVGSMNHPNVMAIYDVGDFHGTPYVVCELLEGETLRSRLERGAMPLTEAVDCALGIAAGLAAAHAKRIIHRDLKPENVFLTTAGLVKILDFGLARFSRLEGTQTSDETHTAPGLILGTASYMAPEQVRAEPCDHRSDIFSFGAILYEMLNGNKAFACGTAVETMTAVLNTHPPAFEAPQPLVHIVRRCLEKNPAERFQSVSDLAFSLKACSGTDPVRTVEPQPAQRAVAVLPFKLLPKTSEDEYLSVALADSLINQLSSSDRLLVRPVAAVVKYANEADAVTAARELNVGVVVQGSIQKMGPRLRVYVQAWDMNRAATVLSAKYDAEMADFFGLQDIIAEELTRTLGANLRPQSPQPAQPKNAAANELFLRGVERISRFNHLDTRSAIEMLEEATRLDPTFVDAWARLAEAYRQMGVVFEPSTQWIRKAESAVRKAMLLDPANADVQCIRGRVLWTASKGFQNRAALRALHDALEINPGCYQALLEGGCLLFHIGLYKEAENLLARTLAASPGDVSALSYLAMNAVYKGEYDEAEKHREIGARINPTNIWNNLFGATVPLYTGELNEAEMRIKAARQLLPNEPMVAGLESLLWARRGESRKAESALKRALRAGKSLSHAHHTWHAAAAAYAVLGQPAKAVLWLRKASDAGLPNYLLFRDDPHFQSMSNVPSFARMLAGTKRKWQALQREFSALK
jgi:serine/threonine protein kinase/Tfp pilus assembly protein PilF